MICQLSELSIRELIVGICEFIRLKLHPKLTRCRQLHGSPPTHLSRAGRIASYITLFLSNSKSVFEIRKCTRTVSRFITRFVRDGIRSKKFGDTTFIYLRDACCSRYLLKTNHVLGAHSAKDNL